MINIVKSWLFRNKWCIFAQKHLQAKHNIESVFEMNKLEYKELTGTDYINILK